MARILIVEDNPQNLKLASVLLRTAGHEVLQAYDAQEAEEALARGVPDLILMDLGLPGKDGYSLTRELRQRRATSKVPILAVTSFAMKGDEERALAAGCTAYLPKPINAPVFLRRVEQLLAPHRLALRDQAPPAPGAPSPTGTTRPIPAPDAEDGS